MLIETHVGILVEEFQYDSMCGMILRYYREVL